MTSTVEAQGCIDNLAKQESLSQESLAEAARTLNKTSSNVARDLRWPETLLSKLLEETGSNALVVVKYAMYNKDLGVIHMKKALACTANISKKVSQIITESSLIEWKYGWIT